MKRKGDRPQRVPEGRMQGGGKRARGKRKERGNTAEEGEGEAVTESSLQGMEERGGRALMESRQRVAGGGAVTE